MQLLPAGYAERSNQGEEMRKDDEKFLSQTATPGARADAVRRWRRARFLSFASFLLFSCAAIVSMVGDRGALCGLLAGVAALQFAVMISTDMKIKVALLADELAKKDSGRG